MAKNEELSKAELYRKERKERLAKEAKKNAKRNAKTTKIKRVLLKVVAVVAAVAIVASATIAIVNHTGSLFFRPAIAKVGDTKITTSEFQYYYRTSHTSLMQTAMQTDQQYGAGYYAQYQGFDYTKTPSEQPFPNEMIPAEEGGKTYATWDDYLTEETIEAIQYLYAAEAEAVKAGVTLTDEETASVTTQIEQLRTTATQNGATLDAYLTMTYGSGINEKNITTWMMRDTLVQKFSQMKGEELTNNITLDAINAEYEANKQSYMYVDLRLYVFDVDTSEIKDGTSQSDAENIQKEADEKAKNEADEFLKNITTEEEFINAADALDKAKEEEKEDETTSAAPTQTAEETTSFEKAQYTVLEQAFGEDEAKWLMDEARKTGDKKVVAYKENDKVTNYYAVFVSKPAYRDDALGNNFRAYAFTYTSGSTATSTVSDEAKAETKAKAQGLVDHWTGHDAANGSAETFASLLAHVYPEDASTIQCQTLTDYTTGTLPDEVEEWASAADRKHNDVALIETETGCYVVYFDSRNTEATWQKTVKSSLGSKAYTEYEEALLLKPEYTLTRDGAFMSIALKMNKSKINRDIEKYLYLMQQSQSAQSYMSY